MKGSIVVRKKTSENSVDADGERPQQPSKLEHVPLRLLRCRKVDRRTGLSRSSIWRLEHRGAFPKRSRVSVNVVAWVERDVIACLRREVMAWRCDTTHVMVRTVQLGAIVVSWLHRRLVDDCGDGFQEVCIPVESGAKPHRIEFVKAALYKSKKNKLRAIRRKVANSTV